MIKAERINGIVTILEEKGVVNIIDLSRHFSVTAMTIRRDLDEIEKIKCIRRTHGGAIYKLVGDKKTEIPTLDRMDLFKGEKNRIARKATQMIQKGETVFLGSGTTTFYLARELENRDDITVVTNSVIILNELATNSQCDVIMVGGFLRRSEYSLIGHFAADMINNIHVDKVIIGMGGVHSRFGLTSNHPQEIMTDRLILEMSVNIIVLADHTKIGQVAAIQTAKLKAAKTIITTQGASHEMVDSIKKAGVEVILV